MAARISLHCEGCGYARSYGSQAMADRHFGRHSCEKQRAADARSARGLARHAAIDRAPKPCLHKQADHQHGTYACYTLDRCRCLPCCAAQSAYETNRVKQHAYGRWDHLVDAEPARAYVRALMAAGLGAKRIPAIAGVPVSTVNQLVFGKRRSDGTTRPIARIRRVNAEKLLATTAAPTSLAGGVCVDATGTRRRIQALVRAGWSHSKLADRLLIQRSNFIAMMNRAEVTAATARKVAALYDELWDTAPPEQTHRDKIAASRSRNYARREGWLPALAWDDESIDQADAQPATVQADPGELDEIKLARLLGGDLALPLHDRSPELVEALRRLAARGLNDRLIGERLHRAHNTVGQLRRRYGIPSTPITDLPGSSVRAAYGPALRNPGEPIVAIAPGAAPSEGGRHVTRRRTPAA